MKCIITIAAFIFICQNCMAQNVGIGITAPLANLHIYNGSSGGKPFESSILVVENNAPAYVNLLSPKDTEKGIVFGEPESSNNGGLLYNNKNTPDGFQFRVSGNLTRMVINNSGSVGIGIIKPNASALLDLSSSTQGLLPPRMTMAQRNAISAPAEGLIIHCSDCNPSGPYTYNGASWASMTASTPIVTYTIGQAAQGGIVFWVDDSGQHGLVAGTQDVLGAPLQWWFNGPLVFCNKVRNDGIYTGHINTDSIISRHNIAGAFAAGFCAKYLGGGYGDWYLPSLYELGLLFNQKAVVGGFSANAYWSSTEATFDLAYIQYFGAAGTSTGPGLKTDQNRARAIRRF